MSDLALGSASGYIYQFEKALLTLSRLQNGLDSVSIENVDDVAAHDSNGSVLMTFQAKHSILTTGTTFEDTSKAIWRTFEIWIKKINNKTFNNNTLFICSTNKKIPNDSLLYKIKDEPFNNVIIILNYLLTAQKTKLTTAKKGTSIKKTIEYIEFVLSNQSAFETIKNNLQIEDGENVKEKFFVELHLTSDNYTDAIKGSIYDEFYGWVSLSAKAKWLNAEIANFSKNDFDNKYYHIITNSSIMNAVFRTKKLLGTIDDGIIKNTRQELFVRQLEDIKRNSASKERIILKAIHDFIYSDVEIKHIIIKGDYTEYDFEIFVEKCKDYWQDLYDSKVLKELDEYNEEEKNLISIEIYDSIMKNIELKFKEGFSFTTESIYVKNGCFLNLSNKPEIGWRPDWETKYKNK
ncbi:ABC-three component system protein [Flavobacterium sp.]|uniref:ABC-three component system protein n=1 Tax=Flavobacterium sp. TaxID=239 RepID=UPI003D134339